MDHIFWGKTPGDIFQGCDPLPRLRNGSGDSSQNTSCSSGWQTIPGLKPPWRRDKAADGADHRDMMTVPAA